MNEKQADQVLVQATDYFRDAEMELVDIHILIESVCDGIAALDQDFRRTEKKTGLVPYPRRRPGKLRAQEVNWCRPCRSGNKAGSQGPAKRKERKGWVEYLAGGLTRDRIHHFAKDASHAAVYIAAARRATALNEARAVLVNARMSLEHTFIGRAEPAAWEGGTPDFHPPLVSLTLPDSSKLALGRAWSLCLRMASVEVEMMAMRDRYDAEPAYRGLRLAFERDAGHRYGRLCWMLHGERLLGLARGLARDPDRTPDNASLPDRVLRKLRIPARARVAIAPHEARRRGMTKLHQKYCTVLGRLKKRAGEAKALAALLLEDAKGPPAQAI